MKAVLNFVGLRTLASVAAMGSFLIACDSVSSPSDDSGLYLRGEVVDTAFRPVSGARIEVLDGKHAGATATSNGMGLFEFSGAAAGGGARVRASRAGFQTATMDAAWQPASFTLWARFRLTPIEPALEIEPGPYTLTITNDLATATGRTAPCEGFPTDLTTRTFEGTMQVSTSPTYAYLFEALPTSNPTLKQYTGSLALGVAGQFIGFWSDDVLFSEGLPGFRYLQIMGSAPTSEPATVTGTSITVPFLGDFWYCQTTSASNHNNCSQVPGEQRVDYRMCSSAHDRMVFTKR